MNYLYKIDINKIPYKKLIFIWTGLILFNIESRINENLSAPLFIMNALSNQYYIIYFMIPIFLLIIISSLDDDNKYVLIRHKTYWNYFKPKLNSYFLLSVLFVVSQFMVLLIMSIGLKNNNDFNKVNFQQYKNLTFYYNKFSTPILPIFFMIIYMILGLFIISLFLHVANHFLKKQIVTKIIILMLILMFSSIKIVNLKPAFFLFINTYVVFYHSFIFGYGPLLNLIIEIIFILLICNLIKNYWNKNIFSQINLFSKFKIDKSGINKFYLKKIINKYNIGSIIFVLVVMCIWKLISTNENSSINRYLVNVFAGTSIGEKRPLVILEMLVLNLTPIYILSLFIEQECNERTIFFNIRLKKSFTWFKLIINASFKLIFIYTILNILIPVFIGALLGLRLEDGFYKLIVSIFIIKFLNIIFEFLILFLIYSFAKNTIISFFSLLILNLFSVISFKLIYYIPFGISSLYRYKFILNNYGIKYYYAIYELILLNIIIFIQLKSKHKKLIIN